jgi:alpha-amylase/alpha-mannosidase (GH57 family)
MTPESNKLKVAFLWHMHQPYYLNPETNKFMMPWVRLHGLKDYLDMPLLAAKHGVKFTFNLVPSLIDQIELYCNGYVDRHQELSRVSARELTPEMKREILRTFFSANFPTMINPYARYRQLYRKQESCGSDIDLAVDIYSTSEWRDLQVWSNLTWIDPMFRNEKPIARLYQKGRDYTEQDKNAMLDYQIDLLRRIIPTYNKLYDEGKIDISFTPYYHPILPLLIDTDIATEAIPDVALPKNHFNFPEDAGWHIQNSVEKYRSIFNNDLKGLWPSEGSVSEAVLKLVKENNIKWIATDEEVLHQSLLKSGMNPGQFSQHSVYTYEGAPDVKIFFRDHGLSDKIGFVYSGWDIERAVTDFMQTLKNIKRLLSGKLDKSVVPIILDGENAWEYFPRDGSEFLNRFCETLVSDDEIEVISFTEAAENIEPVKLSSLFAGSWINHNFRIWIGHIEDNHAWDALYNARKTLIEYQKQHPETDPKKIADAWQQIHICEGSDWCWWFGDDHIGAYNAQFDALFRAHLSGVYQILGIETPMKLLQPIHRPGKLKSIQLPEALITPIVDGNLTHYYEWSGAGHFDCSNVGGAMHRVEKVIQDIYFAFDFDCFYIRLDFDNNFDLVAKNDYRVVFEFNSCGPKEALIKKGDVIEDFGFGYAVDRIMEARFHRKILTETGNGSIEFNISVFAGDKLIEKWPPDEMLKLELPDRNKMSFWQV